MKFDPISQAVIDNVRKQLKTLTDEEILQLTYLMTKITKLPLNFPLNITKQNDYNERIITPHDEDSNNKWRGEDLMKVLKVDTVSEAAKELLLLKDIKNNGLYLGDYLLLKEFNINGKNVGTVKAQIVGFNSYKNFLYTGCNNTNHIIFQFDRIIDEYKIDEQCETIQEGFINTKLYKYLETHYKTALINILDVPLYPLLRNFDNSGYPNGRTWSFEYYASFVWLPTIYELTGKRYKDDRDYKEDYCAKESEKTHVHLPAYKINKDLLQKNNWYWTQTGVRGVSFPWCFAHVNPTGRLYRGSANAVRGIAPCFAL